MRFNENLIIWVHRETPAWVFDGNLLYGFDGNQLYGFWKSDEQRYVLSIDTVSVRSRLGVEGARRLAWQTKQASTFASRIRAHSNRREAVFQEFGGMEQVVIF